MSPGVVNFAASSARTSARRTREPAGVVADPRRGQARALPLHLHVGAFGEHGVEMGVHDQHGSASRRGAAAEAHDVAFGVHLDVAQPVLAQHLHERLRPRLLLEGGRGNLGQRDQLADEAVLVGLDERHGLLEFRPVDQAADRRVRRLGRRRRRRGRDKNHR